MYPSRSGIGASVRVVDSSTHRNPAFGSRFVLNLRGDQMPTEPTSRAPALKTRGDAPIEMGGRAERLSIPRSQGPPVSSRLCVLVSVFVAVLVIAGTAAPSASAASTCAVQGFTVAPLQSNVFYIDVDQDYLGSYVGYRVTNTSGSHKAGLWMR